MLPKALLENVVDMATVVGVSKGEDAWSSADFEKGRSYVSKLGFRLKEEFFHRRCIGDCGSRRTSGLFSGPSSERRAYVRGNTSQRADEETKGAKGAKEGSRRGVNEWRIARSIHAKQNKIKRIGLAGIEPKQPTGAQTVTK